MGRRGRPLIATSVRATCGPRHRVAATTEDTTRKGPDRPSDSSPRTGGGGQGGAFFVGGLLHGQGLRSDLQSGPSLCPPAHLHGGQLSPSTRCGPGALRGLSSSRGTVRGVRVFGPWPLALPSCCVTANSSCLMESGLQISAPATPLCNLANPSPFYIQYFVGSTGCSGHS